jgi:HPt (histidine-containing phosphotransfer) domain-containing protein
METDQNEEIKYFYEKLKELQEELEELKNSEWNYKENADTTVFECDKEGIYLISTEPNKITKYFVASNTIKKLWEKNI